MSGRRAPITQRAVQLIVRGVMKAGAKMVTVRVGDAKVDISLTADDKPIADDEQIKL